MLKQRKWQPFVPASHANVQLVIDPSTKSTIDTLFFASARIGNEAKFSEAFATSSIGLPYILQHYITKYMLYNETAFLEKQGYWRTEILFDIAGNNRVEADFLAINERQLLMRLVAVNTSQEQAEWTVTFLSAPNANCADVVITKEAISFDNGRRFNIVSLGNPLFQAPPLSYGTSPKGLGIIWGAKDNAVDYSYGFMPRYHSFSVEPQSTLSCWYVLGIDNWELSEDIIRKYSKQIDTFRQESANIINGNPQDSNLPAMNHLFTQIKFNRRYPPKAESVNVPAFTACPSMDVEYNWDAGYSSTGLAIADKELAVQS